MDPAGVAGVVVAALAVATTGAWLQTRWAADAAMEQAEAAATEALGRELASVDQEIDLLAQRLAAVAPADADACTRPVRDALTAASLDSMRVQRFLIAEPSQLTDCSPDGAQAATAFRPAEPSSRHPDDSRLLTTASSQETRLAVVRRAGGRPFVAMLDSRALRQSAPGLVERGSLLLPSVRMATPDGGEVALTRPLDSVAATGHHDRAWRSGPHGVRLRAIVDRASLRAAWRRTLPLWLIGSALGAAAVLAGVWQRALRRQRAYHRIASALRRRQFEPFIQPFVDLRSGRCVGGEILMRWQHPQRGWLGPAEFIEEAERTGLIVPMSELVMSRAVHRLADVAAACPDLVFSFNVTPSQLRRRDFTARLHALFHAGTVPQRQVLLELTERDVVDPQSRQALLQLAHAGWRIAVDDFGTGHSSLATLERLPVEKLKIDRAFVADIGSRTVKRPVLDAVIAMASELNLDLVAEGVETPAQAAYLAEHGVATAQGYLYAKPMPLSAFPAWLTQGASAPAPAPAPEIPSPARPRSDRELQLLLDRMVGADGVDVRDRSYHLRVYRQCFVAREAVDWIVRHEGVARDEAVRIGRRLVALGKLRHVVDEHDFQDADLFFTSVEPPTADSSAPDLAALVARMRQEVDGVRWGTHHRWPLVHRRCATGHQIVDWIVTHHRVDRATAARWAAAGMRAGRLRHVFDDRPFVDGWQLYRPA